jgi:hypothetical protein
LFFSLSFSPCLSVEVERVVAREREGIVAEKTAAGKALQDVPEILDCAGPALDAADSFKSEGHGSSPICGFSSLKAKRPAIFKDHLPRNRISPVPSISPLCEF